MSFPILGVVAVRLCWLHDTHDDGNDDNDLKMMYDDGLAKRMVCIRLCVIRKRCQSKMVDDMMVVDGGTE